MKLIAVTILAGSFAMAASGQCFNIDIGQPGTAPADAYAAAGLPGHWLSLPATQSVTVLNLVDIAGAVTNVSMYQTGGSETLLINDPALSGNDATLMNDCLITHTSTENCLYLYSLQPGQYEILIYARMPAQPTILDRDHVDQEPGTPFTQVGGVWPGHHQEGVSFSRHTATVPSNGTLGLHAGVPPGGNYTIGAAMNGIQVRRLVPGDVNGDGHANVNDLLAVINAWGRCPAQPPLCAADISPPSNGDGAVTVNDLLMVINNWG